MHPVHSTACLFILPRRGEQDLCDTAQAGPKGALLPVSTHDVGNRDSKTEAAPMAREVFIKPAVSSDRRSKHPEGISLFALETIEHSLRGLGIALVSHVTLFLGSLGDQVNSRVQWCFKITG